VNFTVTESSLQNQTMNIALKSERPDVDAKRANMIKLQGEFKVKIREIEDQLLACLAQVEGSILESDQVFIEIVYRNCPSGSFSNCYGPFLSSGRDSSSSPFVYISAETQHLSHTIWIYFTKHTFQVIKTMAEIKTHSKEIAKQVAEVDGVMAEIQHTTEM
jgi:hypothetical protein